MRAAPGAAQAPSAAPAPGAGVVDSPDRRSDSAAVPTDRSRPDIDPSQSTRDSGLSIVQLDLANDPQARARFFQALAEQAIDLAGDSQHAIRDTDHDRGGLAENVVAKNAVADDDKAKRADEKKDAAKKETELGDRNQALADDNDAAFGTD